MVGQDSSVRIATGNGLDFRGWSPDGGEIFRTRLDQRWGPPSVF